MKARLARLERAVQKRRRRTGKVVIVDETDLMNHLRPQKNSDEIAKADSEFRIVIVDNWRGRR